MKVPLLALLAASLSLAAPAAARDAKDEAAEAKIEQTLRRIVIPKMEFRDTTFLEALDFFRGVTRQADRHGRGIPIFLELRPQFGPPEPPALIAIPGLAPDPPVPAPEETRITVSLTKIPLLEALRYVVGFSNVKFRIQPDGIHILSLEEPDPLFTRDFRIPSDFFPAYEKQDRLDHTDSAGQIKRDIRAYLEANGAVFPHGAAVILNDEGTRLTARNTREHLDFIGEILKTMRPPPALPVPGPEVAKVVGGDTEAKRKSALQHIILPKVAFANTPLREAIKTLSDLGTLHSGRSSRGKWGLNIAVQREAPQPDSTEAPSPPAPPVNDPKITYAATKVSLWDALEAVARLIQCEVFVEKYAVVLKPPRPADAMITREYLVPPMLSPQSPPRSLTVPGRDGARDWLTTGGVAFEANASAAFNSRTRRLIVRDTPEEQKKVQARIEQAWREYYAAEKATKGKAR